MDQMDHEYMRKWLPSEGRFFPRCPVCSTRPIEHSGPTLRPTMTSFSSDTIEEGPAWPCFHEARAQARVQFDRLCATIPSLRPRQPKPRSYPPISSIPQTSPERLAQAAKESENGDSPTADTVLYLAYGSNLSAETFLGMRGIRPISQVNVSAPAFDLSFDLPGLPYREPCFANLQPRHLPKPPLPGRPPIDIPPGPPPHDAVAGQKPKWIKGLYGVVYEVTRSDYATIVATEGGGASYHDVLTPCFALPPSVHVPEKPPIPELPKPFLAHSLYAPRLPDIPDHPPSSSPPGRQGGDDDDDDDDDGDEPRPKPPTWWRKLLLPVRRPQADYAQPSARYLKLIRDGAREHALPDDYLAYLAGLQTYTITSTRQKVGQLLMTALFLPVFALMQLLGKGFGGGKKKKKGDGGDDGDGSGQYPPWAAALITVAFNLVWLSYDCVFRPLFGDGERTEEQEEKEQKDDDEEEGKETARWQRHHRKQRCLSLNGSAAAGDEKNALMSDW